jgi:hypothetical protein
VATTKTPALIGAERKLVLLRRKAAKQPLYQRVHSTARSPVAVQKSAQPFIVCAGALWRKAISDDVNGTLQEIPNDFVWIFAGGTPPYAFLKKIGVGFGARDLTLEASREAKSAETDRKQLTHAATAPSR